jgi:peptidoglycan/xylan/chitin deacetylase (PgdA/CDA1 family)
MKKPLVIFIIAGFFFSCQQKEHFTKNSTDTTSATQHKDLAPKPVADAATIMARREVPVLCYHQIRDWTGSDSKNARDIIVPVELFKAQLKILADSGYHTILPDQLYNYLTTGAPLPPKPFMLTYDDTDDDQYNLAWQEMKKYGFKGVYFIMTVSLNRPKYMTREQVKELSDAGNVVASHTWDHHMFTGYKTEQDWITQVDKPKKTIEQITGKPADYFAYPYGLWNKEGIPELKKRGIKAAFQLSTKRDPEEPLYTIRRMIASGYWSAPGMYRSMIQTFHLNNRTP